MYVLGILLVLGGISQLANLIAARSFMPVPFGVYIVPVLILAAGITVLFNPFATAEIPLCIDGYGPFVAFPQKEQEHTRCDTYRRN